MTFERKLPTEDTDIAEIVRGILTIQAQFAAEQHRPLGRGTHTKGTGLRGTFEVFDPETTIGDPALRARLARGLFAKPGTYPATVRFASAASTFKPDPEHDVRALSFYIEVPAGILGPTPTRLDYSMNNAPTFPINDAHAFASLMDVEARPGVFGKLKALFSESWVDRRNFYATAVRGLKEQRAKIEPYQKYRYWSNVPFLHGPDEAMKYSAIPRPGNPSQPLGTDNNALRDELVRHVTTDQEMSSFDFALQLLDVDRMRHHGKRQDAIFWVENASVEWNEEQAPFHVVGRLTLERASILSDAAVDALHIDVNENALPDSRPLGSLNRARWAAESASRRVRQAAPAAVGIAPPLKPYRSLAARLGDIRLGTAMRWAVRAIAIIPLLVLLLALATVIATQSGCGILPEERVDAVEYPDQGWGPGIRADGRQTYYYTPQGAVLKDLRYSWFVNLEMPLSRTRLADPSIMRRYGFLVDDDGQANPRNPDRLPVGFAKHFDRTLNEEMLDITCSACHTGQINVTRNGRTTALRVDGGSAMHAFTDANLGHFVPTLMSSILSTVVNPLKFRRFAHRVLGDRYEDGFWPLHRGLMSVASGLGKMGYHERVRDLTPTEEGYGRTDALARIANTVFGDNIDAANYRQGSAPVNYPPVWNIWKFDWVQYNASVSQPMARNIGEAMGTGAKYTLVDRYGRPLPPDERFRSTAMLENLHTIELTLRRLQPPAWNEAVMGPVDRVKAQRGKELFQLHCEGCHGPFVAPPAIKARNAPLKTDADPLWLVRTLCTDDIGTDPTTAANFARRPGMNVTKTGLTADDLKRVARLNLEPWRDRQAAYLRSSIAELQAAEQTPETAKQLGDLQYELTVVTDPAYLDKQLEGLNPADLTVGAGLSYLGVLIREKAYADNHYTPEQRADRDGFGILDLPQVIVGYKPRPLAGIWASPPFLHNGSVPTIYDLLSPVADRPRTFRTGSREYDTEKLGLAPAGSAYWEFDTSKEGNYNRGHEFNTGYNPNVEGPQGGLVGPLLSHDDRIAIIEHLKIRNDDLDGPQTPKIPAQCAPAP